MKNVREYFKECFDATNRSKRQTRKGMSSVGKHAKLTLSLRRLYEKMSRRTIVSRALTIKLAYPICSFQSAVFTIRYRDVRRSVPSGTCS